MREKENSPPIHQPNPPINQPTAGNGSTIVCDPFAKSCMVNEANLNMFLNGGVKTENCLVSECLAPPKASGTTKKGGKALRHYA